MRRLVGGTETLNGLVSYPGVEAKNLEGISAAEFLTQERGVPTSHQASQGSSARKRS